VTLAEPPAPADQPVTFRKPPVTEVVLAIQFEQPVIDLEVLAEFTAQVKAEFPQRSQHPPLPRMAEDLSVPPSAPSISLELASGFLMPRTWFMSADNTRILQLQEDRFVFNWQRPNPVDALYPRYQQLREGFREHLAQLVKSIQAVGKEVPGTNFCEVTYVNQVTHDTSASADPPELGDILTPVATPTYDFLFAPEDQQYSARFRITSPGEDGLTRGRLYVSSAPTFRPDGTLLYILNLTSRLVPEGPGSDAAWAALDLGREWIVKGFVDLTTKKMHDQWGYERKADE
jgi:uncharacterized protein (TIGR04255 family)